MNSAARSDVDRGTDLRRAATRGTILLSFFFAGCSDSPETAAYIPRPAGTLTFNADIAPIVHGHCTVCHRPGESGPFDLADYRDVKRRALQIADVTSDRFMPPWLPEPGYGEFADERRLDIDEIGMIRQWVDEGAAEGDPGAAPDPPRFTEGWQLGEPDLVVTMPEPFTLPPEGTDVFRHFAIPIPVEGTKYVRGFEFRASNPRIVHHARMLMDSTGSARKRDANDPEPGFSGMVLGETTDPHGHWLGWTPGKQPYMGPADIAWRLDEGTDLVLEMHMLPTGKPETIQASLGLFFADEPPSRVPVILRLGPRTIDIPPGNSAYVITDTFELPVEVEALNVYAHAHLVCRSMEAWAELPDGRTVWLLKIPEWDFNWQDDYRYAPPVALPRGTVLHMRYVYDNSTGNVRNPQQPPRRVLYGQLTSNEMGDFWLQVLPRNDQEREKLEETFALAEVYKNIEGYAYMVRVDPDDLQKHNELANWYMQVGNVEDAAAQFAEVVRLDPQSVEAQYNLGLLLQASGHLDEAIASYRRAIELRPDYAEAYNNLGNALLRLGRPEDAIGACERAIDLGLDSAAAHLNLAFALRATGRPVEAAAHLVRVVADQPRSAQMRHLLATTLAEAGRLDEAIEQMDAAALLEPDQPLLLNDLAWLLATNPSPPPGAAERAVALAERADAMTGHQSLLTLDTLAAAYAAAGRFDDASATAQTAVSMAGAAGRDGTAADIRSRLELYRRSIQYRDETARRQSTPER